MTRQDERLENKNGNRAVFIGSICAYLLEVRTDVRLELCRVPGGLKVQAVETVNGNRRGVSQLFSNLEIDVALDPIGLAVRIGRGMAEDLAGEGPSPEDRKQMAKNLYDTTPCYVCGGPRHSHGDRPQIRGSLTALAKLDRDACRSGAQDDE